jgi:site-specific recombinase XerD
MRAADATTDDLTPLLSSWKLDMDAARLSKHTVDSYIRSVRYYLAWCDKEGYTAPLTKPVLNQWVTHILARGSEATTARTRQQAVRRFSAWLADPEQGEVDADLLVGVDPPKLDVKVVEVLTTEQLRRLVRACHGKELRDRRDEACVRLLIETGIRASELLGLNITDVDLQQGTVAIRRGKGGKGRYVPIGPQAGAAVDRYLRVRRHHKLAQRTPALWLTETGGKERLGYHGLRVALLARAKAAGIEDFHIHKMRHTWTTRAMDAGGSEGGVMAIGGWSRRDMLDRYAKTTAEKRGMEEIKRLNLGDL